MARKTNQILLGSLSNYVLLALRSLENSQGEIHEIMPWLLRQDYSNVLAALRMLAGLGYITIRGQGRAVKNNIYQLSDTGAALVHPVTGSLSRRKIAEAEPPC